MNTQSNCSSYHPDDKEPVVSVRTRSTPELFRALGAALLDQDAASAQNYLSEIQRRHYPAAELP